jgi:cell division protein FtsB
MIITLVVLSVSVIVLGVLFFFLEKRQQALLVVLGQLQEDTKVVQENCHTLRHNDDILEKDLKMLLHEFKDIEKKVKRSS